MQNKQIPNILSIAGLDPSGGAGIIADVKTISALGGYACAITTALTVQNTQKVSTIFPTTPSLVSEQIETIFSDIDIECVKIGMVAEPEMIFAIVDSLRPNEEIPIVLDPIIASSTGRELMSRSTMVAMRDKLIPLATVITPNLFEIATLVDISIPQNMEEMRSASKILHRLMSPKKEKWIYLKGGHLKGEKSIDLLFNGQKTIELASKRIATNHDHGTGCTLSAALATLIPKFNGIEKAAREAKKFVSKSLIASNQLDVGKGVGPLNHFPMASTSPENLADS